MDAPPPAALDSLAAWERLAGVPRPSGHATAAAIAAVPGGWVVAGSSSVGAAGFRAWVLRLDAGLGLVGEWRADEESHGRAVAALPDGGWLVAGEEEPRRDTFRAWLLRFAPDGAERWRLPPGAVDAAAFASVGVAPDGAAVVGGTAAQQGVLIRVEADGRTGWERAWAGTTRVAAVAALPDGGAVAAGNARIAARSGGARVMGLDADGAPRWDRALSARGLGEVEAAAALPDGGAVAVGRLRDDRAPDGMLWVVRVDAKGGVAWARSFPARGIEAGRAVAVLPGGAIAVAGDSLHDLTRRGACVWLLDADGEPVGGWTHEENGHEIARAVAAAPDGSLVVASSVTPPGGGSTHVCIRHLTPEGRVLRERRFGGGAPT